MILSDSLAAYFNLGIILIIGLCAFLGVRQGFVKQFIELLALIVALIVAWLYAPVLARFFIIYKLKVAVIGNEAILRIANLRLNTIIWFIIIFVLVSLFMIIVRILSKTISKLPIINLLDKFLGGFFGAVQGFLIVLMISFGLSNAFFLNGVAFKEKTILRKFDVIATKSFKYIKQSYEENEILQKFVANPSAVSEEQRQIVEKLLKRNGYSQEDINSIFYSVSE